jgi:hypothetical protein
MQAAVMELVKTMKELIRLYQIKNEDMWEKVKDHILYGGIDHYTTTKNLKKMEADTAYIRR